MPTEIGKQALLASFEPILKAFRLRPGQVRAIRTVLHVLPHDELREFPPPKGRHDFVWAARNYLKDLPHEELLVAFGSRRGRNRNAVGCLRRVHRTVGARGSVTVTPKLLALIEAELEPRARRSCWCTRR